MPNAKRSQPAQKIQEIVDWMVDGARTVRLPQDILGELCQRLVVAGLPLHRAAVFVRTLHPDIMGRRFLWRPGEDVLVTDASFSIIQSDEFQRNPVAGVIRDGEAIRRPLDQADCPDDFKILAELRAEGITDYLAQPLSFTSGEFHAVSWTTRRPGGFDVDDLAALEAVRLPLSRLAEIYALKRTAVNLLDTYVGRGAGERILRGAIRRGDTERIRAAILMADLRGFTRLSNERPGDEVISFLNAYFDCLVPPIEARGGEVLKYMGDGLLAIFPLADGDPADICRSALSVAGDTAANLIICNNESLERGGPEMRHALAFHIGDVLYGNIGGSSRLDFTAIGPGVNLTARLQTVAAELGRDVVTSAAFAQHCGDALIPLGEFALKGFGEPQEVFGLGQDRARPAPAGP